MKLFYTISKIFWSLTLMRITIWKIKNRKSKIKCVLEPENLTNILNGTASHPKKYPLSWIFQNTISNFSLKLFYFLPIPLPLLVSRQCRYRTNCFNLCIIVSKYLYLIELQVFPVFKVINHQESSWSKEFIFIFSPLKKVEHLISFSSFLF